MSDETKTEEIKTEEKKKRTVKEDKEYIRVSLVRKFADGRESQVYTEHIENGADFNNLIAHCNSVEMLKGYLENETARLAKKKLQRLDEQIARKQEEKKWLMA